MVGQLFQNGLLVFLSLSLPLKNVDGFVPSLNSQAALTHRSYTTTTPPISLGGSYDKFLVKQFPYGTEMHMFGGVFKRKGDDEEDPSESEKDSVTETASDETSKESDVQNKLSSSETALLVVAESLKAETVKKAPVQMSALEKAKELKAQAERIRDEAKKLDTELMEEKIDKLEKSLITKTISEDPLKVKDVEGKIIVLKKKLNGEVVDPAEEAIVMRNVIDAKGKQDGALDFSNGLGDTKLTKRVEEIDAAEMAKRVEEFEKAPKFLKEIVVKEAGMDIDSLNVTALILQIERNMVAESPAKKGYTDEQIAAKLEEAKWFIKISKPENETEFAIELLDIDSQIVGDSPIVGAGPQTQTLLARANINKTMDEVSIEGLFPPEVRKEGMEPSAAQAKIFVEDVLAKNNTWVSSASPEKVSGGFIIRGSSKYDTGKELVEEMEANFAKSRVRDQLNFFYVNDPTDNVNEDMFLAPVLYITTPDISRTPTPIRNYLVTFLGLGSLWYTSIFPYLLNSDIMKRVNDQLDLSEAGMVPDVAFLNEMAFPLFLSFLGIALSHEAAHKVVASSFGMKISAPTFVPSLATGLTSSITHLKSPPKNKQELFDFAIVGPLTGIAVSIAVMCYGLLALSTTDQASLASLPSLPLNLLRQSSLGGGIIDAFLPGLIDVPSSPDGLIDPSLKIPLHPAVIAGYLGLLWNALNLLPVGSKFCYCY